MCNNETVHEINHNRHGQTKQQIFEIDKIRNIDEKIEVFYLFIADTFVSE